MGNTVHFSTDAVPGELPALWRRLIAITGWEPWKKRLSTIENHLKANVLLGPFYANQFRLELEALRIIQRKQNTGKLEFDTHSSPGCEFCSFVTMVSRVHQRLGDGAQRRLRGMIIDGLKDDKGLRPLENEMAFAAHLMANEFELEFNDLEYEGFDFLAAKNGKEVEIECKLISGDLGRQIHRRRLIQLSYLLLEPSEEFLTKNPGGHIIRIRIPTRLHGTDQVQKGIAEAFISLIRGDETKLQSDFCEAEIQEFDFSNSPFCHYENEQGFDPDELNMFFSDLIGKPDPNAFLRFDPRHGALMMIVESDKADQVMKGVVRQLKSASNQFTRTRPAIICARFSDLTPSQLLSLHGEVTALQLATSQFLQRESSAHIHTVAYGSQGELVSGRMNSGSEGPAIIGKGDASYTQHGDISYFIRNPNHPSADDLDLLIFG